MSKRLAPGIILLLTIVLGTRGDWLSDAVNAVGNAADTAGNAIGSAADTVESGVGTAVGAVGGALSTAAGAVGGALDTAANATGDFVDRAFDTVQSGIHTAVGAVSDAGDTIKTFFTGGEVTPLVPSIKYGEAAGTEGGALTPAWRHASPPFGSLHAGCDSAVQPCHTAQTG